jgi:hypothetical protein
MRNRRGRDHHFSRTSHIHVRACQVKTSHAAIALAGLTLLGVRVWQAFTIPIADFDTAAILEAIDQTKPWRPLSDIAHPGGLAVIASALRALSDIATPAHLWSAFVAAVLAINVITLTAAGVRLSRSRAVGGLLALAYLASPVTADLSGRAEENLLHHAPFILAVLDCRSRDRPCLRPRSLAFGV